MAFNFGILSDINIEIATYAFLATIAFLILVEFLTGALEYSIEGNLVYNQMLQKIYKELMMMGLVSFVIAMYQATDTKSNLSDLFRIVDFVGYILFFVAIFYVAHALYIMFVSVLTSTHYERMHALSLADILEEYITLSNTWVGKFYEVLSIFSLSSVQRQIEFKIIYALFRDTYWLPPDFDYGAYLSGCLARYSQRIINVGVYSWLIMVLLALFNLMRVKVFGQVFFGCTSSEEDNDIDDVATSSHRQLNSFHMSNGTCEEEHTYLFLISGLCLCCYTSVLLWVGQVYSRRLIGKAGVSSVDDYEDFIVFEESSNIHVEVQRQIEVQTDGNKSKTKGRRMSINTFRSNIELVRADSAHSQHDDFQVYRQISSAISLDRFSVPDSISSLYEWFASRCVCGRKVHGEGTHERGLIYTESPVARRKHAAIVKQPSDSSTLPGQVTQVRSIRGIDRQNSSSSVRKGRSGRRIATQITLQGGPLASSLDEERKVTSLLRSDETLTSIERYKMHKLSQPMDHGKKRAFLKSIGKRSRKSFRSNVNMKLEEDFSDIYVLHSPALFFRAVETAIMLNSLYLSLWVVNFITIADRDFGNSPLMQTLMLVPVLFVLPCIGQIVKVSSMLSAIAELNLDVIGVILEETEDKKELILELQRKIARRIKGVARDQKEVLVTLFAEIDSDGSGEINKAEFRNMLRALHLHYSDAKFKRLYKAVDRNKDGSINITELNKILFPSEAEAEDIQKRADIVDKHVQRRHTMNTGGKGKRNTLITSMESLKKTMLGKSASSAQDGKKETPFKRNMRSFDTSAGIREGNEEEIEESDISGQEEIKERNDSSSKIAVMNETPRSRRRVGSIECRVSSSMDEKGTGGDGDEEDIESNIDDTVREISGDNDETKSQADVTTSMPVGGVKQESFSRRMRREVKEPLLQDEADDGHFVKTSSSKKSLHLSEGGDDGSNDDHSTGDNEDVADDEEDKKSETWEMHEMI